MIHSDQAEFFFTSLPPTQNFLAPNVAAHSYYDSVYLKIVITALSFLANLRLLSFANVL